ncbi:MAG TPA: S53 family peptidase [Chloroflexota bacterium]|nr:S53 family peptidase [Chloroflexota bacterium]
MIGRVWKAAVCLAAASVISGCAPGQSASPGGPAPGVRLAGDAFATLLLSSRDFGRVGPDRPITTIMLLKDPNAARESVELTAMYTPGSPRFGRYETPGQVSRNGPSPRTMRRVRSILHALGMESGWQPGSSWMTVSGTAGSMARALRVDIHDYVAPDGARYYAALHSPVVPRSLRFAVRTVGHISSYRDPLRHIAARAIPDGGLRPSGLLAAYDLTTLQKMGNDGAGQTVAFPEIDGINASDLKAFSSGYGLPPMNVTTRGATIPPPGGEVELDLEIVHEIAPLAKLIVYYCGTTCNSLSAVRDQMARDMATEHPGAIISDSVGICEGEAGFAQTDADRQAYQDAASFGEPVYAASGDSGAYDCLDKSWGAPPTSNLVGADEPPSVPSVTSVGGTRLSVNADGSWYREEVWESPGETEGSGGAQSQFYPQPDWQKAPGVSGRMREEPDVAAVADTITSPRIYVGGTWLQEGGTSQAAPIWAGMTALIDGYLQKQHLRRLGFMNRALYAMANGHPRYPPFHDITVGDNLYYRAGPGYDLATGLGSPDGWNLARDLATYIRGGGR